MRIPSTDKYYGDVEFIILKMVRNIYEIPETCAVKQEKQINKGNIILWKMSAQGEGLPYPTMIELNSDQIWKCKLLVTIDLIEQKIIFRKY